MPELPEVETVRSVLASQLKNLTIEDIDIRYPAIINTKDFKDKVCHKTILDVLRYGKFLIFELSEGTILSHLRMEGKYFYVPAHSLENKHIHVIFYLSNGYMLCYQDVRKFGRMEYKSKEDLYETEPLKNVGIDPILSKEIEIKGIYDKIVRKSVPIKTTLLDQSIVCGLGNIYVDEVLYQARISPLRSSKSITLEEVESLVCKTKEILSQAILCKGTTIRSYTSSLGVYGTYQKYLCVHTKKECPCCNEPLEKIRIGGRSTYFCKKCQR